MTRRSVGRPFEVLKESTRRRDLMKFMSVQLLGLLACPSSPTRTRGLTRRMATSSFSSRPQGYIRLQVGWPGHASCWCRRSSSATRCCALKGASLPGACVNAACQDFGWCFASDDCVCGRVISFLICLHVKAFGVSVPRAQSATPVRV